MTKEHKDRSKVIVVAYDIVDFKGWLSTMGLPTGNIIGSEVIADRFKFYFIDREQKIRGLDLTQYDIYFTYNSWNLTEYKKIHEALIRQRMPIDVIYKALLAAHD